MTKADHTFSEEDHAYMKMALNLARRGLGTVAPNPAVGCVIVKDGHVIGRGWTGKGGRPHAETIALKRAINAAGSTAYVTLEPCAHHGETPPCAEALVVAGVKKVIIATVDPDPRVKGGGIKILKEAGVEVDLGLMKVEAETINQGFFQRVTENRPLVTVKIASSQDGKIAKNKGEQTWITGPEARRRGHLYRANHDAIMVGIGTALIDDPMLDCRIAGLHDRSPIRIVIDTNLRINAGSKLCETANDIPLWIMTASEDKKKKQRLKEKGVKIFQINVNEFDQLDLGKVMNTIADQGITRLLCEGGAQLNASLIRASLVDRLVWFKSADSIGENGVSALYDIAINDLDHYLKLTLMDEGKTGDDQWQEFKVLR